MCKLKVAVVSLFILSFSFGQTKGQTLSTYSSLGIGDLYLPAQAHQQGMGGLGISNSNVFYQSSLNPALLADNSIYSFAAGFAGENKSIWQNNNREKASGGTLSYLNMVLPLLQNKIAMSIGLSPYSIVNYNFSSEAPVEGNPDAKMSIFNKGFGGFNQFSISTGLKLTKGLYVGGKASYIFGSIQRERNNVLTDPAGGYIPTSVTQLSAADFIFGVGAVYKYYISNKLNVSIGGVYDFGTDLSAKRSQRLQTNTASNTPVRVDTLYDNAGGFLHMPETYGVGFSIHKMNRWMFGTDIRFQQWGDYKDFDGENNVLVNARLIKIGGEFIPDITSVDNYFARITYRFGLNLDQTPYYINNTQINEFGINFGLSLPVSNFSSVDMGFRYGSRGTTDENLVREDFFRVYFGITFNDNRWFVRPKFN